MKKFGDLPIGEKFYLPSSTSKDDNNFEFKSDFTLIKVSTLSITKGLPSPSLKHTPNVFLKKHINAVIIDSTNGTNGFYDFVPHDLEVFAESTFC